jgi:ATPase subunit of ABC transporter with duplicated ATPase domains
VLGIARARRALQAIKRSQATADYRGVLLVASHDLPFLRTIGITRWLRLEGRLIPIDPP